MIRINLLPAEYRRGNRISPKVLGAAFGAALAVAASIGWFGIVYFGELGQLEREDAKAHELLMCIAQGKLYDDPKRMRHDTSELYIKSPDEMMGHFSDVPEAVENTVRTFGPAGWISRGGSMLNTPTLATTSTPK